MAWTLTTLKTKDAAVVYQIKSNISGHRYIGSTVDPVRRKKVHFSSLKKGRHQNFVLQRAFDASRNMEFSIVCVCPAGERFFYEQIFIDKFGDYNICKDAGPAPKGSFTGLKHSQKTKTRMSEARKNYWLEKRVVYDNKCQNVWQLIHTGMGRQEACDKSKVSYSTFLSWVKRSGLSLNRYPRRGVKPQVAKAKIRVGNGSSVIDACKAAGISQSSYYRGAK
jgi:group I intron endonuclease